MSRSAECQNQTGTSLRSWLPVAAESGEPGTPVLRGGWSSPALQGCLCGPLQGKVRPVDQTLLIYCCQYRSDPVPRGWQLSYWGGGESQLASSLRSYLMQNSS